MYCVEYYCIAVENFHVDWKNILKIQTLEQVQIEAVNSIALLASVIPRGCRHHRNFSPRLSGLSLSSPTLLCPPSFSEQ